MSNFNVVTAAQNIVTDANRATTRRLKFKAHHYEQQVPKTKEIPKTWENNLKISDEKNTSSLDQTTPWNTRPLNTTIEYVLSKE